MAYVEIIRIRFLSMLAYRLNYFSGILTYVVYTGAYYFLWNAVYGERESLGGMTPAQMSTYLVVSWMSRAFYFNNLDRELADEIKSGAVAVQLLRPFSYLLGKLTAAFGEGLFRLLFWMLPGLAVAAVLFPVSLPASPAAIGFWALAALFAFLINALLNLIFGLMTFYLHNAQGLQWAKRLATDLLSGLFLPLHFYPEWFQQVSRVLPFQAIAYIPGQIFTEGLRGSAVWWALLTQAGWALGLGILVALLWRKARRHVIVQGG